MGVLDVVDPDDGADTSLDDLVRRAGLLVDQRRRPARPRAGRARPGPGRGRGARGDGPGGRGGGRPVRRAAVGRHLRGRGGPRRLRRRRRDGERPERVCGRGLPGRRGRVRRHGGRRPCGVRRDQSGPTRWWTTCGPPWSSGSGRPGPPGIPADRIVLDAGLGPGTSARQALALLRASDRLVELGHPVLLSVDDKTFLDAVPVVATVGEPSGPRRWPPRRWPRRSAAGWCGPATWPPTTRSVPCWPPSTGAAR